MTTEESKSPEKALIDEKITKAFHKLEGPLVALVNQLGALESPATVDKAEFSKTPDGLHLEYRIRPASVSFIGDGRRITITVDPIVIGKSDT